MNENTTQAQGFNGNNNKPQWIHERNFFRDDSDVILILNRSEPKHHGGQSYFSCKFARLVAADDGTGRPVIRDFFGFYHDFQNGQAVTKADVMARAEVFADLYMEAEAYVRAKVTEYKQDYHLRMENRAEERARLTNTAPRQMRRTGKTDKKKGVRRVVDVPQDPQGQEPERREDEGDPDNT
jgi:hypothetical protein